MAFYGEQVIINLVNSVTNKKKKYEGQLEDTFRKLIIDLNQVIFAKSLRKGPKKALKSPKSWFISGTEAEFCHFLTIFGQLEDTIRKLIFSLWLIWIFVLYSQNDVHYEAFDFHKECSKMRYDRLVLLKDQLAKYSFGYFHKIGSVVGSNQVCFHAKVQIFWGSHRSLKKTKSDLTLMLLYNLKVFKKTNKKLFSSYLLIQ